MQNKSNTLTQEKCCVLLKLAKIISKSYLFQIFLTRIVLRADQNGISNTARYKVTFIFFFYVNPFFFFQKRNVNKKKMVQSKPYIYVYTTVFLQ